MAKKTQDMPFESLQFRKQRPPKTTLHHIKPKSAGGSDLPTNLVAWDKDFHATYHHLFDDLTLEEIIQFLKTISVPGGGWTKEGIRTLKESIKEKRKTKRRK